jgi:hypothetical protein
MVASAMPGRIATGSIIVDVMQLPIYVYVSALLGFAYVGAAARDAEGETA